MRWQRIRAGSGSWPTGVLGSTGGPRQLSRLVQGDVFSLSRRTAGQRQFTSDPEVGKGLTQAVAQHPTLRARPLANTPTRMDKRSLDACYSLQNPDAEGELRNYQTAAPL